MANKQVGITNPAPAAVRGRGRTAGESARERLLAGLPVTERRLSLNGVRTAVLEGGGGPPIVLLHGPGAYGAHWLHVIPSLVTTHRVIAPDLPGHGASEMFDGPLDTHLVSGWLDDLIECTCSIRPVVVGQTLGGAVAARFASERSDRLAALALVDTLGLSDFQPTPEFASALNEFLSAPTESTHDLLWSRCAFDLTSMRRRMGDRWESLKAYNLDRARTPGILAALRSLMERFGVPAIPPETLAGIAVPTTLIWGRHDLATPLSIAEEASARFGWGLHVIDDAADDPPIERPEAFVKVLRAVIGKPLEKEEAQR